MTAAAERPPGICTACSDEQSQSKSAWLMPEYTNFARKKLVRDGPVEAIPTAPFVELEVTSQFSI